MGNEQAGMSDVIPVVGVEAADVERREVTPSTASPQDVLKRFWIEHPTWKNRVRPKIARLPTPEELGKWGPQRAARYVIERYKAMKAEVEDPLWHGFEPPSWTLWDCLLGVWWVDQKLAAELREALGFRDRLSILHIYGSHRSGKSRYSARTMMRVLFGKPGVMPRNKMVMCFSDTQAESRVKQQDVMFQYMPEPFKSMARSKGCKVNGANIKYGGKKTGFTDDSFLTPGESLCRYLFYSQPSDSHEGVPVDALWLTEVKHAEFVTGQRRGLADTKGFMLVDFTPIWGYSPAVRLAMNGAREVMSSPCFWLPEDGGEPDVEAAMYVDDLVWRIRNGQLGMS